MSNTSDDQSVHQGVDPRSALASWVDKISAAPDWSAADLISFSEAFFDVLRQPGHRSASTASLIEHAFEFLVRDSEHLALHRLVLSRDSSGVKGSLSSVAKACGRCLLKMAAEQPTPCTGVLMALLLLRSHLPASGPMQHLPRWHRHSLATFDAEQALLPYNTMFDRSSFTHNVAELKMALPELDWIQQWLDHGPKKLQTFLYYWPIQGDTTGISRLLDFLESRHEHETDVTQHYLLLTLRRIAKNPELLPEHDPGASMHGNGRRLWAVMNQYALRPLGLSGRRPRVAICVSGQLRGYLPALASWRKHLLPGLDADFYVHTWKQAGRSGAEPFRRNLPFDGDEFQLHYREQCMKLGYQAFVQHYPHLFKALSDSAEVTFGHLSELYGTDQVVLEDETAPEFEGWSNPRKMHHKIAQVQALVDKSGRDYELILRIRPDKAMRLLTGTWTDIARAVNNGSSLLADLAMGVHYGNLMVGDQVAVGRPDAMRIYSATYGDALALETQGLTTVNTLLRGHVSLARQCLLNGLQVGKFPAIFGGLLGFTSLSSTEIQAQLSKDAEGRSDPTDRILIAAVTKDLSAR